MPETFAAGEASRPRALRRSAPGTAILAAAIALAAFASYSNSFSAPFVFDDIASIPLNPTIRRLWPPLAPWLPPPGGRTVSGRPVLNVSFALNYAQGGLNVRGYHAVNLAIHILAAWTLFGLARRTLSRTTLAASPDRARFLAFAIALFWALHPLQTESVTYVVQRAESLMGLFYLLTLYCFIRGVDAGGRGPGFARWTRASPGEKAASRESVLRLGLSWLACLFGMATKEVMVSAPVIVLLYDRTFVAGTFLEAWRRRRGYYALLAATWLPLAWFVHSTHGRGETAGLGMGGRASLIYARSQFAAILHYLRLTVWPRPLVFDYGTDWARSGEAWILPACGIAVLSAFTIHFLWRRRPGGFLGAWFLIILAPSSSLLPIGTEEMAEHRMYLPLAAVVAAGVCGAAACVQRMGRQGLQAIAWSVLLVGAVGLGGLTYARNDDYRSDLALWRDTAAKRPGNFTARNNLALALAEAGDLTGAVTEYKAALRLEPDAGQIRNNFGRLLARMGKVTEAANQFLEALRLDPDDHEAHNNLGVTLAIEGRFEEALAQFDRALRLKPDDAEAHYNRGLALRRLGRPGEAAAEFETARGFRPPPP